MDVVGMRNQQSHQHSPGGHQHGHHHQQGHQDGGYHQHSPHHHNHQQHQQSHQETKDGGGEGDYMGIVQTFIALGKFE